jgi:hypothetical protein
MKKGIFRSALFIAALRVIPFFSGIPAGAAEPETEKYSGGRFLPHAGILLESGLFAPNDLDYSFYTRRAADVEFFRYGKYSFSIAADETNFFDGLHNEWYRPFRILYHVEFFNLRRDFENGSVGVCTDHVCNNIIDKYAMSGPLEKYQLGWYRFGVKWESPGFRTGYKDRRIGFSPASPFEWLWTVDYQLSAGKAIATDYGYYKAIASAAARIDLFRFYRMVPYVEGELFSTWDWKYRADVSAEAGMRVRIESIDIVPFVRYRHLHNADYYGRMTASLASAGFRLETLIENDETGGSPVYPSAGKELDSSAAGPQLHAMVSYGRFIRSDYVNYNSDMIMRADLFRAGDFTPYVSTRLIHDSPVHDTPWPRYILYELESGADRYFNGGRNLAEAFYQFESRNEGNHCREFPERYQAAGIRIMSSDMKLGGVNSKIKEETAASGWINTVGWLAGAGFILNAKNYRYRLDLNAEIRWDILRWSCLIPYVQPSGHALYGDDYGTRWQYEFRVESGVRIPAAISFYIFYRFMRQINIDQADGLREYRHLAGLKFDF